MASKRPITLAIAGSGSNCGKTTLLCAMLKHLAVAHRVAALKISTATPDHRCARTGEACSCLKFDGSARVLKEECAVAAPRKDTGKFLAAGAKPVHWLQATSDTVIEATREACAELHSEPIDFLFVEGAAPIRAGLADYSILVMRAGSEPKASFASLLPFTDLLIVSRDLSGSSDEQSLRSLGLTNPNGQPILGFTVSAPAEVEQLARAILHPLIQGTASVSPDSGRKG
jgi:molybdopterin-guanine dinucleotide biosynthesis protein